MNTDESNNVLSDSTEIDNNHTDIQVNEGNSAISNNDLDSQPQEYIFDMFTVFQLSKEEVFEKLGTDYELVPAGAEGSYWLLI